MPQQIIKNRLVEALKTTASGPGAGPWPGGSRRTCRPGCSSGPA
jgi:hypothetical protein